MKTLSGGPVPTPGLHLFALVCMMFYVIVLALASRLYDKAVTGSPAYGAVLGNADNAVYTILIALVAGSIGLATTLYGVVSVSKHSEITHSIAEAANAITLALMVLATGSAGRSQRSGQANGKTAPAKILKSLYAFIYITTALQLLYVLYLSLSAHRTWTRPASAAARGHHNNKAVADGNGNGHYRAPVV